ncbi:MAG: GTP-binding protein [Candidatus Lokiarchaeota archaeon]|nr:GTP-binding protein [Candidatus Lokiarchaeota archaeon]
MERQIIKGVIYSELDEELGPNPKAYIPEDFSQIQLLLISVKTFAVLTGEKGFIPESLVILPFPSFNLKGLVKYIKWDDPEKRGGIGQSNIAIFFEEMDDVIFYKYIKEISIPFNDIAQNIAYLEQSNAPEAEYINELIKLESALSELLEELKIQELSRSKVETLQIKDRSLIDYQFKIILVGDPTVGKTSLILRYTDNAFRRAYVSTMGVHVSNKIFKADDSTIIQLVLWDIGGQERFKLMRQEFYQGLDALFLIFDLTNPDSFNSIPDWFSDIKNQIGSSEDGIPGFLIGNKKDLEKDLKINTAKAQELAVKLNLEYIETSANSGENVDEAFSKIANFLYESRK